MAALETISDAEPDELREVLILSAQDGIFHLPVPQKIRVVEGIHHHAFRGIAETDADVVLVRDRVVRREGALGNGCCDIGVP
jgi:hypothetical protein